MCGVLQTSYQYALCHIAACNQRFQFGNWLLHKHEPIKAVKQLGVLE